MPRLAGMDTAKRLPTRLQVGHHADCQAETETVHASTVEPLFGEPSPP